MQHVDTATTTGAEVPRFRGREAAIDLVRQELDEAAALVDIGAESLRGVSADAAAMLGEASTALRARAAVTQSRDGALELGTHLFATRSTLLDVADHVETLRWAETWPTREAATSDALALLERPRADLEPADWDRLAKIAGLPPALRPKLPDTQSLPSILASAGEGTVSTGAEHALQRWQLTLDGTLSDPDRGRTMLRELVGRSPKDLGAQDWARLRVLLSQQAQGPHTHPNAKSLDLIAAEVSNGDYKPGGRSDRYFASWRLHLDGTTKDVDAMREAALSIVTRRPSELDRADWALLGALIDADAESRAVFGAFATRSNMKPLETIAYEVGDGQYTPTGRTTRSFEAIRMSLDGTAGNPARLLDEARALFSRAPSELSKDDWGRLGALLDVDPSGTTLTGPRTHPDAKSLSLIAEEIAAGDYPPGDKSIAYFAKWRDALGIDA